MNVVGDIRAAVIDRLKIRASYVRLFSTPDGQDVLLHIMRTGGITRSCHVSGDSHASAMLEGQRRLALSILRFAKKDYKQLLRQIQDGIEEEEQ